MLNDILIILGLSTGVIFLCHHVRLPAIVGFLITGALAGPHGLKLVNNIHQVETMAEIGVILLLFTIGIEFSLKNLMKIKRAVLWGGSLQLILTVLIVFLIALSLGYESNTSVFLGFLISLSSTAIVMKIFQERAEVESPHGRTSLAILIFQDIAVVIIMLITPVLAGATENLGMTVFLLGLKGVGIILLVFVGYQWIVPNVFYYIARTRSRELFLISIVVLCLLVACITAYAGLSLALGAFLAGLVISESDYSYQAISDILPFKDIFTSFFFVSIGMLLNIDIFIKHIIVVSGTAAGVILLKTILTTLAVRLTGYPLRAAILAGMGISQIGEFSFVLAQTGLTYHLITPEIYQIFLAVTILTMVVTPFIIAASGKVADILMLIPGVVSSHIEQDETSTPLTPLPPKGGNEGGRGNEGGHLIIIGFGMNGKNLAKAARMGGIPYTIIEMNPETVKNEKKKGEPIHFGDASSEIILNSANIFQARIIVIGISDMLAARAITQTARRMNPRVHIIVRTRFFQEISELYELGADDVVAEEFETSIEIFTRVLTRYLIPHDEIEKFTSEIRAGGYQVFRSASPLAFNMCFDIPDMEIRTFRIAPQAPAAGISLGKLGLRKKYGVTILSVRRGKDMVFNPDGDTELITGDLVIAIGKPVALVGASNLFSAPSRSDVPV